MPSSRSATRSPTGSAPRPMPTRGGPTRWPTRLTAAGGGAAMAVLNAGISRNELLADTAGGRRTPEDRFAPRRHGGARRDRRRAQHRHQRHRRRPRRGGDRGGAGAVRRPARAAGKRVFLTTITPSDGGSHGTPAGRRHAGRGERLGAGARAGARGRGGRLRRGGGRPGPPRAARHAPRTRATGCTCRRRATARWPPPCRSRAHREPVPCRRPTARSPCPPLIAGSVRMAARSADSRAETR